MSPRSTKMQPRWSRVDFGGRGGWGAPSAEKRAQDEPKTSPGTHPWGQHGAQEAPNGSNMAPKKRSRSKKNNKNIKLKIFKIHWFFQYILALGMLAKGRFGRKMAHFESKMRHFGVRLMEIEASKLQWQTCYASHGFKVSHRSARAPPPPNFF